MSFSEEEYLKLRKKRIAEQAQSAASATPAVAVTLGGTKDTGNFSTEKYLQLRQKRLREEELGKTYKGYTAEAGKIGLEKFYSEKQAEAKKEGEKTIWQRLLENNASAYLAANDNPAVMAFNQTAQQYRNDTSYREPKEDWSEEEKSVFGYLYGMSPNSAYQYAEQVNNKISTEKVQAQREQAKQDANAGHALLGRVTNLTGVADMADKLAEWAGRGTVTVRDTLSPYEYGKASDQGLAQKLNDSGGTISEDVAVLGGKGWGDVYSLGTSIADSMIGRYTGGKWGTAINTFSGVTSTTMNRDLEKGVDKDRAALHALASGFAEAGVEFMDIDRLIKLPSADGLKGFLRNIAKTALPEGMEEILTASIDAAADQLILGDKSDFNTLVEEYKAAGLSDENAKKKAWTDTFEDILFAGLAGSFSGGISGTIETGIKTGVQTYQDTKTGKKYAGAEQELIDEGLAGGEGTQSHALAQKMQGQLDNGKGIKASRLGKLVRTNEQQIYEEDIKKIQSAVEARLTQLGEGSRSHEVAEVIVKQLQGQELDRNEKRLLQQSTYAQRVANELDPDNIRSGGYDSGWAEKIGTKRIYAREYNRGVGQPDLIETDVNTESRRLTESDIDDYMSIGDRLHVRDTKQRIVDKGESPILTKQEDITAFIRDALHGKIQKTVKGYGRVTDRLANAVKTASAGDINIDEYYLELDADRIAHISDHVGKDEDVRNIPLSEEQLERLPEYIDTYDDLINIIRRKDGSVRLMLGKKINGHSIIVETVSKGRRSLHPVTAYQIDSEDYMNYYKTRAIDRSSTSRPENTGTVDISRQAIAPANINIAAQETIVNDTDSVGQEKVSFAEMIRRAEHNDNGGNSYEQNTAERSGTRVPDGSGQRTAGVGTGEPAGGLAGRTAEAARGRRAASRAPGVDRQTRAKRLRQQGLIQPVSSSSLGLAKGTDAQNLLVLPQTEYDAELQAVAERIKAETGKDVTFVVGKIQIRTPMGVQNVRGARMNDRIIVQADNPNATATQIADHEIYHDKAKGWGGPGLNWSVRKYIAGNYSEAEFLKIVEMYADAMAGTVEIQDAEDQEAFYRRMEEEVLADAYAGIDYRGFGATKLTNAVREYVDRQDGGKLRQQDNGVRQTNGPNGAQNENTADDGGEQYSYDEAEVQAIQSVGKKSINAFSTVEFQKTEKLAKQYWHDMKAKSPFFRAWFGDWRENDQTPVQVADQMGDARGVQKNDDTGWDVQVSGKVFAESQHFANKNKTAMPYMPYINDIVRKAVLLDTFGMDSGKTKSKNSLLMHSLYAVADIGNGPELLKLYVEEMNDPNKQGTAKRAYQLQNIEKASAVNGGVQGNAPSSLANTTNAIRTVADLFAAVKMKDASFQPNPASKVVNAKGMPMVVYHGSAEQFHVFSYGHIGNSTGVGILGDGFYFTDKNRLAKSYGENVYPVYLQMKTPYMATESDAYKLRTQDIQAQGYDGVILRAPQGDVYMVFENTQIKSATDNIGTFDGNNADIRYSYDDSDYDRLEAQLQANQQHWRTSWLKDQLGEEGYKQYQENRAKRDAEKKAEQKQQDKAKRQVATNRRSLQREYRDSVADAAMTKKLQEGAKPTEAKRELKRTILDTFSIPTGSRAEAAQIIESYADRIIKNGQLTDADRKNFFDRMYSAGVMTVAADEYMAMGREYLNKGRIYVSDSIRRELGDDWAELRRRAFGAGVYLTNDRSDAGVDVWQEELSQALPGLFDSEETDLGLMLERIVQVAEEGRDEQVSLAEYTARLAGQGYVSEDEVLDRMERDLDTALRVFARTAGIEIKVKAQAIRDQAAMTKQNMRQRLQAAQERQNRKEQAQLQQEQKELRELQQKTLKSLQWLSKNRHRAPEELQAAFDEVLSDLDIYAVGAANAMRWSDKYNATWKDLAEMYQYAKANDPNFMPSKELEMIVSRLHDRKIEDLDVDALNDLYKAAVGLRTEYHNRNNVLNDEMNRLLAEVYTDSKAEIEEAAGSYKGNAVDRLFNAEQLTPMNVMQRMGGWNPDGTFYSMAKQLEKGERDVRAFTVKANRMLENFLTEHADWVKKADGQGKDAIWYSIEVPELLQLGMGDKPIFGDTVVVHMTPAQKVHMYLESKNVDNLRHMAGGRTFADQKLYSEGKRQEAFAQGKTIKLAPETVKQIVSDLTAEERELAGILEKFYNDFSKGEINRVSNILYGYDKAMGKSYAPIFTNQNYVNSEIGLSDQTAEGVSNLKARQVSKNPSYQISAFDAFERSVDQTARFVGMAIPARNWNSLLSWQERNNSMGDVITHKWGAEAKRYIEDLLVELQSGKGEKKNVVSEKAEKLLSNYISAVFGSNPGIVLKQLGSIPMAGAYLGGSNVPSIKQVHDIDRSLIAKYTQDLDWRSMGYSMPETKQLKDNPNWTQTNKAVRFALGGGAITAMDTWAASTLWPWAENKVRKEHPELEIGTKEQIDAGQSPFYKKVAEEFESAVARSQSVSDTMHQSTLRKSNNAVVRMLTMFRSDSAQTYNTLRQKIGEAQYYKRSGTDKKQIQKANRTVGTAFLAALSNFMLAGLIDFLMNLWKKKGKNYRDEEGELTLQSVAEKVGVDILYSSAGVVIGGEELAELIGTVLSGERWYGLESTQMSVIADAAQLMWDSLAFMREIVTEGAEVVENGGDLGEYLHRNSGDILGTIKETAKELSMYLGGVPAGNIEAYMIGLLKNVIPGFEAAYDDAFSTASKGSLSEMEGKSLELRVGNILENRNASASAETAQALAQLYEAGYDGAVPSDTPASVTVDGEEQKLSTYQKQVFDKAWSEIVSKELDNLVTSERFREAEQEKQEKMLKILYEFATDQAKHTLFEEREPSSRADDIEAFAAEGLEMTDYLAAVADGYDPEKYLELVTSGLDAESADTLLEGIENLEPEEGAVQVSAVQRWRLCVDMSVNPAVQIAALANYMDDNQIKKAQIASNYDINLSDYVKLYEVRTKYDANGNKSYSQAEYKAAIDSLGLDTRQSAILWQLATGAKSAKNNPYSKEIGERVLKVLG